MSRPTPSSTVSADTACDALRQMIFGFAQGRLLFSAIELDVFSRIAQGCDTADALHAAMETDARATRIFLDGLVGAGLLQKSPQTPPRYAVTPEYAPYLTQDGAHSLAGLIIHGRRMSDAWGGLTEVLRRGRPSGRAQALTIVEEQFAELVSGMAVANDAAALCLAQALWQKALWPAERAKGLRILDVGCGTGHWSAALLRAFEGSAATLVDFPRVMDVAARYMDAQGLSSRVKTLAGDLEELDFEPRAYDLAVLANVCHAIGPQASQNALKNVAAALAPGGRVVIVEPFADENRAESGWPLMFGVSMLVSTDEGDALTPAQCDAWLTGVGLSPSETLPLRAPLTALLSAPAS